MRKREREDAGRRGKREAGGKRRKQGKRREGRMRKRRMDDAEM
jgi:hypothetical protein